MNIVLIGYMGSGKSTVGKILSKQLDFEFVDLDDYIQDKEQLTISQVFKDKGEIYFRKKEHLYLNELLKKDRMVLSLGGGTPCYGNNMDAILSSTLVQSVYLKSSISQLAERLRLEKASRPLIAHLETEDELIEFIGKHLFERSFYYNRSRHIINTDNKSAELVVQEIITALF